MWDDGKMRYCTAGEKKQKKKLYLHPPDVNLTAVFSHTVVGVVNAGTLPTNIAEFGKILNRR